MHAFGSVFAEVAVDPDFGLIRVRRLVGAYGAGRIVNPRLARSQVISGMVGGIGMALFEHTIIDRGTGRIANATLADYLMPVNADITALEAFFRGRARSLCQSLGRQRARRVGSNRCSVSYRECGVPCDWQTCSRASHHTGEAALT